MPRWTRAVISFVSFSVTRGASGVCQRVVAVQRRFILFVVSLHSGMLSSPGMPQFAHHLGWVAAGSEVFVTWARLPDLRGQPKRVQAKLVRQSRFWLTLLMVLYFELLPGLRAATCANAFPS